MSRLDDVINRIKSGDQSVFQDNTVPAGAKQGTNSGTDSQSYGSRLDQIISRVKNGDQSVFSDNTTPAVKQMVSETPTNNNSGTGNWAADFLQQAPQKLLEEISEKKASGQDQQAKQNAAWFQFQNPGNASRTQRAIATGVDALEEVTEGAMEIPEKVIDAGAWIAGSVGGLFSKDFTQKTDEFIAKDLYDSEAMIKDVSPFERLQQLQKFKNPAQRAPAIEDATVLGDKSEGLLNSLGQMIITQGAGKVIPWWVTTGTTSFGSEAENALNQGASHWQAGVSAAISALAETFTEKMFGGSGLGEKGLINLERLTEGISNKLVQTLVKYGVDMASEGVEEVVSEFAGNLGSALYKEENLAELLASEEALQSYLDAFIGGAVMSGTMNLGSTGADISGVIQDNQQAQKIYGADPQSLITESLEIDPKNTYAQKMQDRLNAGKKITANQLNQMVQRNETALQAKDMAAIQSAVQKRLEALGEPGNINPVAEAIAKKTAGKELSGSDKMLIFQSKYAQRVLNEMDAENIRSGNYDSEWTGSIRTERVNADMYNRNISQRVDTPAQTGYDNVNNQGGSVYGETTEAVGGADQGDSAQHDGSFAQEGNRSGVQSRSGAGGAVDQTVFHKRSGGLRSGKFVDNDIQSQAEGSPLLSVQKAFKEEAGIDCYVISPEAWTWDSPVFLEDGTVFVNAAIPESEIATVVPHETTHLMKRTKFSPYQEFLQKTASYMDTANKKAREYLLAAAKHIHVDIFSMSDNDMVNLYDEINSAMYAAYKAGQITGQNLRDAAEAFPNLFEYLSELDSLHQQFRQETQQKNAANRTPSPDESVGAAPAGFDPLSSAMYKYGNIPEGENAVRPDDLPVSMDGKSRVSYTARTAMGASVTPDAFAELIGKEVAKGGLSYIPITNSETTQKAVEYIQRVGWISALEGWSKDVHAGKTGADMSAVGALLLNNAANAGDRKAWLNILHDYQLMGTNTAQGLQALRILKKLTPSDKIHMVKRSYEQLVEDMHLNAEVAVSEELQREYENAKTDEARNKTLKKIQKHIADQIPSTTLDKWTALRYVNMLGNLRTQGRNIAGNAGMKAVSSLKNAIAAGIESIAHKASGGKLERTKAFAVSKAQMNAAKADFENVKFAVLNGGKYADPGAQTAEFMQGIQDQRTIFKSSNKILNAAMKPMEGYRKVTNWAMEAGDLIFSKSAYARALAGYLKAHGVTGSDYSGVDTSLMDDARLYAIQEAQEQTFRDTNWLSGWISKVGRRKDTPKAVKAISEGIMPFRKTPANVLIRAEEYSPLGMINSVYYSVKAAQKGSDVTGAQVINSWAKTLTGSGIFGLGMLLYNLGMLSTGDDEDEKKESFESMNGWQNYALILPDGTNLTIDFLTPEAMPLLMGAELMKQIQDGGFSVKDIGSALTSIIDPMVQMSMLQGVNETLDNIQYAEDNMGQLLINAGVSYLTQGITNTFFGQLERSFESSRMQTFVDKDSDLPSWLQRTLGKASAKIPGWDYQQIPYINAWGEEEENPGFFANLAYNTLSPSYIEQGQDTPLTRELNRLNEAVPDTNTYPSAPDKTLSYTDTSGIKHEDYILSADEWTALARAQGQTQKRLVENMISTDTYQKLPDEYKAAVIKYAYTYAKETARSEVLSAYAAFRTNTWMAEISGREVDAILQKVSVDLLVDGIVPEAGYNNPSQVQKVEAITGADEFFSELQQTEALKSTLSDSMVRKYEKIISMGYSNDDFAKAYRIYEDAYGDTKKADAVKDLMKEFGITKSAAEKLYDAYSKKAG